MQITERRKSWLLILAAALQLSIAAILFSHAATGFPSIADVVRVGRLAIAAGFLLVLAGVREWPRAAQGLALCVFGVLLTGATGGPVALRTIALLLAGAAAFETIRTMARPNRATLAASVVSLFFALAFVGVAFRWMQFASFANTEIRWMAAYFVFSAAMSVRPPRSLQSA